MNQPIISGVVKSVIPHPMNNPMQEKRAYVSVEVNITDCMEPVYDVDMRPYNCMGLPNEDWGWEAEFTRFVFGNSESDKTEICFLVEYGSMTHCPPPNIDDEIEMMVD